VLLAGVAGTVLIAGGHGANAEPVVWTGGGSSNSWDAAGNWQSAGVPTATSAVTIEGGLVKNQAVKTAITGAAVASSIDLGRDGAAAKATRMQTQLSGTLDVGTLHIHSGGWLQILSPSLAPGVAGLTVGTSSVDDKGILDIDAGNTVNVTSGLTLAGTAQGAGKLVSTGPIVQTAGRIGVDQVQTTNYTMSGGVTGVTTIAFSTGFTLSGTGTVSDVGSKLVGGAGSTMVQSGGIMGGTVTGITSYTQSGGVMGNLSDGFINGSVTTPTYTLSGGSITGQVGFSSLFDLSGSGTVETAAVLTGVSGSTMTQSGGTMKGTVTGIDSYTQSAGGLSGNVTTGTYALTGAAATSSGAVITASGSFDLGPDNGTAIVAAKLSGTGDLVKTGLSTVVLANGGNDFSGTVTVGAGTLEVRDDALPDLSDVTVADGATLQMTTVNDTAFLGTISGETGSLVKTGAGTLTLGGEIMMGDLSVAGGKLQVGTGTSTNTASFDSAEIAAGATLYVASGATLTIRVPNNIINNGHLINDGTVNDDLDNHSLFENNHDYNADVATNTDVIDNNTPGVWTGDVESNAGTINNNVQAVWNGNVETNSGSINNSSAWTGDVLANSGNIANLAGATWTGSVANTGNVSNKGEWIGNVESNSLKSIYNDGASALWTGDVNNNSQIVNINGGTWNGQVLVNNNAIFNMKDSTWTGDVVANGGGSNDLAQIDNYGAWSGAVRSNAATIFNVAGSWTGDIKANKGLILNNFNDQNNNPLGLNHATWTGDIVSNGGEISNDHGGTWNGKVLGNAGSIVNESSAKWVGDVTNSGDVRNQAGADWKGDVVGNAAGKSVGNYGGTWEGKVTQANLGAVYNSGTWTGEVSGNGGDIHNGSSGAWNGAVESNAGTIENDADSTWTGDVLANAGTIDTAGVWDGDFTNAGTVNAEGEIDGAFDNSGLLHLTGSLTGITTLTNSGTVDLRGNGASQVLDAQTATFKAGSVYGIDVDAAGGTDRIDVTGLATLAGTVIVRAGTTGGAYDLMTPYTILTAGSIAGEFTGVTTDLAFLTPELDQQVDHVDLKLARNDLGFAEVGTTQNQQAAAAGAESLGAGNEIYDALLWLNKDQAGKAFDSLSGEGYASFESVSIQAAGVIADLVTERLDRAFGAAGESKPMAVSAYADGPAFPSGPARDTGTWAALYGASATLPGDGNTSDAISTMGGFAGGLDGLLGDWRLGAMLHVGRTSADVDDLDTSGKSTDYGAGLYGGRQWGDTTLSLGATYTRHDWDVSRGVDFQGLSETLSADYSTGTAQAFGKVSHAFRINTVSLIPYASFAYVNQNSDAFTENGGAAALQSGSNSIDAAFTTLGLGSERTFAVGDMLLTAKAGLGWRHAYGDAPGATHTLSGGDSFFIVGASIPSDMVVLDAGLNFNVSPVTTLDITYKGQIGNDGAQAHALKGTWAMRF
jgi:outer membrane autotransporter protein